MPGGTAGRPGATARCGSRAPRRRPSQVRTRPGSKLAWSRPHRRHRRRAAALPDARSQSPASAATSTWQRPSLVASPPSTRAPAKALWTRELGAIDTGCLQMPKGVFGVTGTPVYDPARRLHLRRRDRQAVGARRAQRRAARRLADRAADRSVPRARLGRHRARQRARLPRASRRTAIAGPTAGACSRSRTAPARSTTLDDRQHARRRSGRRRHLGLGRRRDHARRPHLGGERERQHRAAAIRRGPRPRRVDRRAQLVARAPPREPRPGHAAPRATSASARPRSSSRPARCGALVAAEGKDGAVYLWPRAKLAAGPVQRLELAFPATLYGSPAWDPLTQQLFVTTSQGYAGDAGRASTRSP